MSKAPKTILVCNDCKEPAVTLYHGLCKGCYEKQQNEAILKKESK